MKIQKLESINAFVAVDLENVPGRGILRASKKILQGGAKDLARSMTYGLASLNLKETGISAGISTTPEEKNEAIKTFFEEISEWGNEFTFTAGLGVKPADTTEDRPEEKLQLLAMGTVISALSAKPDAKTAVIDDKFLSSILEKELTDKYLERLTGLLTRANVDEDPSKFRRYGSERQLYNFDVKNLDAY